MCTDTQVYTMCTDLSLSGKSNAGLRLINKSDYGEKNKLWTVCCLFSILDIAGLRSAKLFFPCCICVGNGLEDLTCVVFT